MKRISAILAVAASALGVLAVTALPASASNDVRIYTNTMPAGGYDSYACTWGKPYKAIADPAYSIVNNCSVRIWLYQYSDGTGYNYCVSPGATLDPNRLYIRMWISYNTSNCGS